MSARKDIYDYIKEKGTGKYSGEELRKVGKISEWARVFRQLGQDGIIKFNHLKGQGIYIITVINAFSSKTKRSGLTEKIKAQIRHRDNYKCQACGKTVKDGIRLEVDHKKPLEWEGTNDFDNLWTLCHLCNGGKKNFFSDLDDKVMTEVEKQGSGYKKLIKFFELNPNKVLEPIQLESVTGIRDWERTLRLIRKKEKMNIVWKPKSEKHKNGGYIYIKN